MLMKCQLSVNQGVDGVSTKYRSDANQVFIEGQFRVSIGDINQHSTADAFGTHDPTTPKSSTLPK